MNDKTAGSKIISVYWFVILFLVAGAVVFMMSAFYSPKDVTNAESLVLSSKVAECVSSGGYLNEEILTDNSFKTDFLEKCNLNFAVEDFSDWKEKEQYYLEINIHKFDSNIPENIGENVFDFSTGNINLKSAYLLEQKKQTTGRKIDMIVIHATESPNLGSAINELTVNDKNGYKSIHYLIDRSGAVVPGEKKESEVASHTGDSSINQRSIGIELVNLGPNCGIATGVLCDYGNGEKCKEICEDSGNGELVKGIVWEKYTQAQINSLIELVSGIVSRYDIPVNREHIIGHYRVETDASIRTDPGPLFPWEEFMNGIEKEAEGRDFYVIDKSNNQYIVKILALVGKKEKNE